MSVVRVFVRYELWVNVPAAIFSGMRASESVSFRVDTFHVRYTKDFS